MKIVGAVVHGSMLALGAGCMRTSGHKTVSAEPARAHDRVADQDFARIPPGQLSDVNAAQVALRQAHDGVLRAQQQVTVATQHSEVAKAEIAARKADVDVAKQKVELARSSGDRVKIADADLALQRASATFDLQNAKADLETQRSNQAKQAVTIAQREEAVASAQLESAKLAALRASGDASADHYDATAFQQTLASAMKARDDSAARLRDDTTVRDAEARVARAQSALDAIEQQPVRGND